MKKITVSLLILLVGINLSAQRICPSIVDLQQMQTQDPARYQRFMDLENFTANVNANQRLINLNGTITIPVVVHVLHRGEAVGTGRNISMAQIQSQIDVLNEDFRRLNATAANTPAAFTGVAADYGFEFRLACQDPNGNPTDGVIRRFTNVNSFAYVQTASGAPNETAMGIKMSNISGSDPWPTNTYLNIWVADFNDGLLGYATFPADYATAPNVDGIVVETTAMGRTGNVAAPFNGGQTATHEVGHWLNLRHIWGDAVCGDDFVGDTPPQRNPSSGCPNFPRTSACTGNGTNGDMFMNYMDYTDDGCMNVFTNGQKLRGRAVFAVGGPRASFIDNYFKITTTTVSGCTNAEVKLFNPNCLPVTWSIVSGNATIISSTNSSATINSTAVGQVTIRAVAGNYIDDKIIQIGGPPHPGNYSICGLDPNDGCKYPKVLFKVFTPYVSGTTFQWYVNNVLTATTSTPVWTYNLSLSQCGQYIELSVIAVTPCGTSNPAGELVYFYCPENYRILSTSPNPAKDLVAIKFNSLGTKESAGKVHYISEIKITDEMGNVFMQRKFRSKVRETSLNISTLKSGIYNITVFDGVKWYTNRIIKE
jgi:Pregnancy-associated plasma protein-A/Secretion system C-terminal sorting domain